MEHWQKLCLVLDTWVVPSRNELTPNMKKNLIMFQSLNLGSLITIKWFHTKKRKSDTFIELVIPAS
jgi:hypothetical protein